jgi:hypothetical protein
MRKLQSCPQPPAAPSDAPTVCRSVVWENKFHTHAIEQKKIIKTLVVWDITPCSPMKVFRLLEPSPCCLLHSGFCLA